MQVQQLGQQISSVCALCKQGHATQTELANKMNHCEQECATQRQKWTYLAGALSSRIHAAETTLYRKIDQSLKIFKKLQLRDINKILHTCGLSEIPEIPMQRQEQSGLAEGVHGNTLHNVPNPPKIGAMTNFGDYETQSCKLITTPPSSQVLLPSSVPEPPQHKTSGLTTAMDNGTNNLGQEMIIFDNKLDSSVSVKTAQDIANGVRQCYPPNDLHPLRGQDAPVELSLEAQSHPLFNKEFFKVLQAPYPYSRPIRFVPDGAL